MGSLADDAVELRQRHLVELARKFLQAWAQGGPTDRQEALEEKSEVGCKRRFKLIALVGAPDFLGQQGLQPVRMLAKPAP